MADEEVTFDYVKNLKDNKTVLLIDVREPSELANTGKIPGSINIPLASLEETLKNTNDKDFEGRFQRQKPKSDTPLVFCCQSGNRSKSALNTCKKLGFTNVKHYAGGWSGWEAKIKAQDMDKPRSTC